MSEDAPAPKKKSGYGSIPYWPFQDGTIRLIAPHHKTMTVYACLCAHSKAHTWHSLPGVEVLAHETKIDRRDIQECLRRLEFYGLIIARAYPLGGKERATVYEILSEPPERQYGADDFQGRKKTARLRKQTAGTVPAESPEEGDFFKADTAGTTHGDSPVKGGDYPANSGDSPRTNTINKINNNNTKGAKAPKAAGGKPPRREHEGGKPPSATPEPAQVVQGEEPTVDALEAFLRTQGFVGSQTRKVAQMLAEAGVALLAVKKAAYQVKENGGRTGVLHERLQELITKARETKARAALADVDLWQRFKKALPEQVKEADRRLCADAVMGTDPDAPEWLRCMRLDYEEMKALAKTNPDYLRAIVAALPSPKPVKGSHRR